MEKDNQRYVNLFEKARNFDTQRFEDYRDLVAFYEGSYKLLASYDPNKPWVVDVNAPYASDAVDIRVASLQSSDYVGELEPLSPEDEKDVFLLNEVVRNFWNEMNMDSFINEAIEKVAVVRDCFTHIIFNKDEIRGGTNTLRKGVFEVYSIDPSSFLIDPNALSLKTADYCCVVERITRQQAKDNGYISDVSEIIGSSSNPDERGEVFEGNEYNAYQEDVLTKWTFYEKVDKKIIKTILLEKKIVEQDDFLLGFFPICQLRWKKKFKSPYSLSLMDRLIDLQKSINAIKSATTNVALQFSSPSFVVNEASGINPKKLAEVIGVPGLVIKGRGDLNNAVKLLFENSIDPNLIGISNKHEETIYKLAGATPEFLGDLGTTGNTSGGTENAIIRAKIIEQNFLKNLQEYVEDLTRVLVRFIVLIFSGKQIYARGSKKSDGKFDFKKYDLPERLKDMEYTYSIHLDIKTPFAKEKTKNLLKELFAMEQQYQSPIKVITVLDILKEYDIPNRKELVERYENLTTKDSEAKSEIITQWTSLTFKHNIDPNLISQGIMEIIDGKELKIVEEITKQIEQKIVMEEQQALQKQQQDLARQAQYVQKSMEQESLVRQATPTGDEVYNANNEAVTEEENKAQNEPLTGDETYETF